MNVRTIVPASARETWYRVASALVLLVAGLGYISGEVVALWSAAALAAVTLLFAVLHSLDPWRTALYALGAAIAPICVWYSLVDEHTVTAVLGFAAAVFGITTAASKTVTAADPATVVFPRNDA